LSSVIEADVSTGACIARHCITNALDLLAERAVSALISFSSQSVVDVIVSHFMVRDSHSLTWFHEHDLSLTCIYHSPALLKTEALEFNND